MCGFRVSFVDRVTGKWIQLEAGGDLIFLYLQDMSDSPDNLELWNMVDLLLKGQSEVAVEVSKGLGVVECSLFSDEPSENIARLVDRIFAEAFKLGPDYRLQIKP